LSALRRTLFLSEVREAESELKAGASRRYEHVEALLDDIRS
jgi:hypothetical protein